MSKTTQERKDAAYLENLQALASHAAPPANTIDEIRKWEGSAAAINAAAPQRVYNAQWEDRGPTDPFAILALVFGILGGVLGVIFGHVALYRIGKSGDSGYGLAVAGLVLGYASILVWLIWLGIALSA